VVLVGDEGGVRQCIIYIYMYIFFFLKPIKITFFFIVFRYLYIKMIQRIFLKLI
jgi:hypothetical protein